MACFVFSSCFASMLQCISNVQILKEPFLKFQVLNEFFHNVCELDLVFNFYKVRISPFSHFTEFLGGKFFRNRFLSVTNNKLISCTRWHKLTAWVIG